jgi:hypothetical protein
MTTSTPEKVVISSPTPEQSIPVNVPFPLAGVVIVQMEGISSAKGSPLGSPPETVVPGMTYLIDGVPAGAISLSSLGQSIPSSPEVTATFKQPISISDPGSHTVTVAATIASVTVTTSVTVLVTKGDGKGSNHNYILYSDCNPVTNLKVTFDVKEEDLVGAAVFGFQLNAYSGVNNPASGFTNPLQCNWQQYIMTLSNPPTTLNGFIEYFPSPGVNNGKNFTNFNTSLFPPSGYIPLPSFTIPKHSKFGMKLETDTNLPHAVTTVKWFVEKFPNQQNIPLPIPPVKIPMTSVPLLIWSSQMGQLVPQPFPSQDLMPFVACQLNLVGATLSSGKGTITYEATSPLKFKKRVADVHCVESPNVFTAETSNVAYGPLSGTGNKLTQTFEVIP